MRETKLVTVIIPAYNSEKTIARAMDSVIAQTYQKLQLIVINDGSTDGTGDIIRTYERRDSRIEVIDQENRGIAAVRNSGLQRTKGEYFCFLDSDDEYTEDYLETLLTELEQSKSDLAVCDFRTLQEDGTELEYGLIEGTFSLGKREDRIRFILEEYLEFHIGFAVWNKLYRTELMRTYQLKFDERVILAEDLGFNLNYLYYAERVTVTKEKKYRYYQYAQSLSGEERQGKIYLNEYICVLQNVEQNLQAYAVRKELRLFPIVFIKAVNNQLKRIEKGRREEVYGQIREKKFYRRQLYRVLLHPFRFSRYMGKNRIREYVRKILIQLSLKYKT